MGKIELNTIKEKPKGWADRSKVNWPMRLSVCNDQLKICMAMQDGDGIEYWVKEGFEALENSLTIIEDNQLTDYEKTQISRIVDDFNKTIE